MSDKFRADEQVPLFDRHRDLRAPAIDTTAFDSADEITLDEGSSILHVRGLVIGHDEVLHQLTTLNWEQRRRWMYNREVDEPRLTHEYRDLTVAPAFLVELSGTLSEALGVPYDGIWMNWYRDHRDGTSWHADRPANTPQTAIVPVVSLGATRRFLIRPVDGGRSTSLTPAGGDAIVMRGRCQRDWRHSVPKQRTPAAARMSLNFSSTAQVLAGSVEPAPSLPNNTRSGAGPRSGRPH